MREKKMETILSYEIQLRTSWPSKNMKLSSFQKKNNNAPPVVLWIAYNLEYEDLENGNLEKENGELKVGN